VSTEPHSSQAIPANIERLLIVRLGAMGDIVHTLPAVTALRHAFPEAVIGWVIEERWAELLCTLSTPRSGPRSPRRPLVERLHTVSTRNWRSALFSTPTWERIGATLSDLRAMRYQAAVDFQGAIRSALVARCSGARVIYGSAQPWENVASMFYSRQVITRGTHIVEQNLSLAEALTQRKLDCPKIEFPRDASAEQQCERDDADFVILNPGAGWGAKQWPAERYGKVAKCLAAEGPRSLVNFGPGEQELAKAVEAASGGTAESVQCSLTQLIALTRRARLFIGGDTGPMHLAAALGVPVVGLFGPTNPARNGPFGTRSIVLRSPLSITSHSHRRLLDEGLLQISPEQVMEAARQLLGANRD
jgi:heptosyltransferase-1